MSLWIEHARQSLPKAGEEVCGDVVRTFQTEDRFFAVLVGSSHGGAEGRRRATPVADAAASLLEQGASADTVVETLLLTTLPPGEHVPFSILEVLGEGRARVVECDAPPLFLVQGGEFVLLPVVEEEAHGRLVRECEFQLHDGDHAAMVSEGYVYPWEGEAGWGWGDIALAVRRWTDTNCDARELLGALVRTYRRLNPETPRRDVTVVAMHARPLRSATIWTGPPADPARDEAALGKLMAAAGPRVICGDTTAQIAARLLAAELELEPRPASGWAEVPPVARLEGVDLVTEGRVTLSKARERLAGAERARDLPRSRDGATRLARVLLRADRIRFIVGGAESPRRAAAAPAIPRRSVAVEQLVDELRTRGKLVSVEWL